MNEIGYFEEKALCSVPLNAKFYELDKSATPLKSVMQLNPVSEEMLDLEYMESVRKLFTYEKTKKDIKLLVTENEELGIKAATTLSCLEDQMAFLAEHSEEEFSEFIPQPMNIIELKENSEKEKSGNPYIAPQKYCKTIYTNLQDTTDLRRKVEAILCSPGEQYIVISPEVFNSPLLLELRMAEDCEVIHIPTVEKAYYVEFLNKLLEGAKYKLEEGVDPEKVIFLLSKKVGKNIQEENIIWLLDNAIAQMTPYDMHDTLTMKDLFPDYVPEKSAMEELDEMAGLNHLKRAVLEFKAIIREQIKNRKLNSFSKNMIFLGRPGTGKTVAANLICKICQEEGVSNGNFVIAKRQDLIGQYMGHTAPKVAECIERARGGILFIDEAGFLLHADAGNGGVYVKEAVKELIRYMELYQDIIFIFALYPHELEQFYELDAGMSSRISRVVMFEDYSEDELSEIAKYMSAKRGYECDPKSEGVIRKYVAQRKNDANFGNARDIRKLVESAIVSKCIRTMDSDTDVNELSMEDFENGMARLQEGNETKKKMSIGFQV